jgi:membrane-anchored protein YejM (alkaline phosphatase superfamily)
LRDDYPGVHVAVQWVAAVVLGVSLAAPLTRRLRLPERRAPFALGLGAAALLAVLWQPSNAVRLELLREPGATGAFVLGTTVWGAPALSPEAMRRVEIYDPTTVVRQHPAIDARLPAAPVVVLLTIEATRSDVLEGAHDDELPELVKLRDRGAYFPRSVAAGSQTSVSLTTLFTGRYFSQLYWAMYGRGAMRFPYAAEDPSPRFPELLRSGGVTTADYLGLIFLSSPFGITRGFGEEFCAVQDRRHAGVAEVLNPLLRRLGRVGREPFFAYTHVMEPHEPYDRGKLKTGSAYDRYVSEVGVVDEWVGRISRLLRLRFPKRGYLIVTGDHGEAFGEHGTQFHSKTLYEELVRVPLVISGPGIVGRRYSELVGHVDLGPTILELFHRPVPPDDMGQSLLPLVLGQEEHLRRPLIAEGRLRHALFRPDGLKVIDDPRLGTVEVYDLRTDPGETLNLFDLDRKRVEPAVAELRAFFARYTIRKPGYRPVYKR